MDSSQLDSAPQPITTIPKMDSDSVQRDPVPRPITTPTSRKHSVQLAPVPQPIALFDQFIAGQTEVLHIREKVFSLSGDSFDVKDADGQSILKVKGQVLSSHKAITDTSDNHLFDLVKERFHLHTIYLAKSPDGTDFLKVRSELKCKFLFPLLFFFVSWQKLRNNQCSAPKPPLPLPPLQGLNMS